MSIIFVVYCQEDRHLGLYSYAVDMSTLSFVDRRRHMWGSYGYAVDMSAIFVVFC